MAEMVHQRNVDGTQPQPKFTSMHYHYAGETVAYLIKQYGQERVMRFYRSFADLTPGQLEEFQAASLPDSPATQAATDLRLLAGPLTHTLLRREFDLSLWELDRAVKEIVGKRGLFF